MADLPPHLATVRKIAAWYKVPKSKDLYPVPGKHYTADCQSADTLTAAAVDGPVNVPNNGVASTTTAAAALALVFLNMMTPCHSRSLEQADFLALR